MDTLKEVSTGRRGKDLITSGALKLLLDDNFMFGLLHPDITNGMYLNGYIDKGKTKDIMDAIVTSKGFRLLEYYKKDIKTPDLIKAIASKQISDEIQEF